MLRYFNPRSIGAANGPWKRKSRRMPAGNRRERRLLLERLEPKCVLDAGPLLISEFMAVNNGTLADEDGDYEDWIEIHNPTEATVSLDGWYLTDDAGDLVRWQFPDVSLDAGGYLVVFASGKDRSDPAELHTNFKLDGDGEYLGLVRADGTTVSHDYSPVFGPQYADMSYGLSQGLIATPLIAEGDAARAFVPSNASLGTNWTALGFNDAGWIPGTTGVGYDAGTDYDDLIGRDVDGAMHGINASCYTRVPFQVDDPAAFESLLLRMKYDDGFVAYLNGTEVVRRNAPISPSWDSTATAEHGQPVSTTMSQDFDGGGTAYTPSSYGSPPGAEVVSGGPTGSFLRLIHDDTGGNVNRITFDRVHAGAAPRVVADFDFRLHSNNSPADGFSFLLLPTSTYGDSGPGTDGSYASEEPNVPGAFAVGFDLYPESSGVNDVSVHYNGGEVFNVTLSNGQIDLDAGVFHHAHVELVEAPGGARVTVTLTPNISGTPVVAINDVLIPGFEPYESRVEFSGRTGGLYVDADLDNIEVAFGAASDTIAYEDFDLTARRGLLQPGENVLAIHGLNITAADDDFLVLPELTGTAAQSIQPEVEAYFTTPTPGAPNEVGSEAPSEAPGFSHESGTYVNSFSLALTADSAGAVIHYTTDGSIPTESSSVYESPIWVGTTTRVRARTIEPGRALGPVVSHGYIFLDTSVANFNSDVPLIVLDTYGLSLSDTLLTPAISVFIETGGDGRARITDLPEFAGRSGLRIRGQTSQGFPKKQYAFETWAEGNQDTAPIAAAAADDLAVSLFGMPAESDWVIQGPYSDKTLMRNYLAYSWSNDIGQYAPRVRFCEVFVNLGGGKIRYPEDYVGTYVFMEKIKRDSDRVDIAALTPSDNEAPEVTGGYIWKKDKAGAGDQPWYTSRGQELRHVEPDASEITPQQQAYLEGYINEFESVLYGPNYRDPVNGYAKYIDVDSWIDHWIIVELCKNIDGFRLSTYYHKDREGKIKMGPVWDYNLSLGNADYNGGWDPAGWYNNYCGDYDYPYWRRLFEDPDFEQRLADRWHELRQNELSTAKLLADVDTAAAEITESQARNFQKWNILGVELWPNWFVGQTWQEEVNWMKGWIEQRAAWMDTQFATPPEFSQDGGIIAPGFELTMTEPPGTVYYTLDGSDPRLAGGGVSAGASVYSSTGTIEVSLVPAGSDWRYLDDGSNQQTAWRAPGFNDSAWDSGTAEFGYGDGDEATVVDFGTDDRNKYTTTYFRHTFEVADASDVTSLTARLVRDDGAVVYLNGQEVARSNMDEGTVLYSTFASSAISGGDESTFYEYPVTNLSLLNDGQNVLAVEVHQANLTSSDLSFNLELLATIDQGGSSGEGIALQDNTRVIARTKNGSSWSAPTLATFVLSPLPELAVTEINYNPYDPTAAELAIDPTFDSDDFEFVELKNIGSETVSLVGVEFVAGVRFDFTTADVRELSPGQYVVIASNITAFEARYGTAVPLAGQYELLLANDGEAILLQDGAGRAILDFHYNDASDWPGRADGKGATLILVDPAGSYNLGSNWNSSVRYGGTPGADAEPELGVVINEVLTHTDPPLTDTIELHNPTAAAIDVGGWYLSDRWGWASNPSNGDYKKFRIPDGTSIPAGGYVVFDEDDFNPNPMNPGPNDFALNGAHGDDVWLMKADAAGNLTHFADHVAFPAAANGESFGRWPNGTGGLYPMSWPTLDPIAGANSGPRVGPVILSEVHYNPNGTLGPDDLEFVEIYNTTGDTVDLTGWRIRQGIDFDFADATLLDPYEVLVVVPFDPADTDRLTAFRTEYGIDESVRLVGGYDDLLDNGGERVQLQRPDAPPLDEPYFTPRLLEDEIDYDDESPWPVEADGTGQSLNRAADDAWGHDAAGWQPAPPTPGTVPLLTTARIVGRHIFYNHSAFDGNNAAANAQDDQAVATDKAALLPGQTATFANYSSYSRGLNGVMVDIEGLSEFVTLGSDDFEFRLGNSNDPGSWGAAASPTVITVRPAEGEGGSARVTIIWPDYAVGKQWLQVTVLATDDTRLATPDVFYFGSAPGEAGNSTSDAKVNASDMLLSRNNPRNFLNPAPIDFPYDFNHDARVNATDMLIARNNQTHFLNALKLITVPGGKAAEGSDPEFGTSLAEATANVPDAALKSLSADGTGLLQERSIEGDSKTQNIKTPTSPFDSDQADWWFELPRTSRGERDAGKQAIVSEEHQGLLEKHDR
ncbi:MAG: CotH kinase family protein [Pirellulales bacterium]|nr:CotH kinase family protein [Pirellulales bacterium]